jgi:uncharacterized protein
LKPPIGRSVLGDHGYRKFRVGQANRSSCASNPPSGHPERKNFRSPAPPGLTLAVTLPSLVAMAVAQLTLELRIEHAQSLKDRRQVVRSLKDQLRQSFNISVAELDEAVTWQSATIGVAAVSGSRDYLHKLMEEVERVARRMTNELGAELADSFWEYLEC